MNTDEQAVAAPANQVGAGAQAVLRVRRWRRLRLLAATVGLTAFVAVMALPSVWAAWTRRVGPPENERWIPSEVHAPMPLQPNLVDAPNGPASVIVTGPGGFGANDVFGYDDRAIIAGNNGLYRYVRNVNAFDAGEDLLLSPDGRYVAGRADLEGVDWGDSASDWQSATGVMDLTTGEVLTFHEGAPLAWSPDGRLLAGRPSEQLTLLNIGTGEAVPLGVEGAGAFAFSPDGRQLALQVGSALRILDVQTRVVRPVAELGAAQTLAAPGAWTTNGRLAVWDRTDCLPTCPAGYADRRLSFVDISNGSVDRAGFDAVQAVSARLLGWRSSGDAVVALTMTGPGPTEPHVGVPQVLALHPDGGRTSLISVTADANRIDVARDLLDRFGGQSRSRWDLLIDALLIRLAHARLAVGIIAALVAAPSIYRRVRHGYWPWTPRRRP